MKAVTIREPGGPEVLELQDIPTPVPGPGELLIRVHAAGVNRADVVQRMGFYPPPPGASEIPGLEVSGEVAEIGSGVQDWERGMPVCALLSGGGYAEYALATAAECLPVPDSVSIEAAAALPEAILTVWSNVMQRAGLTPGESLLVHGGSSGIGTAAIQLAHRHGAQVFATAGSAEKASVCESLGALRAINYREEDFEAVLMEATGGSGVNVILDMVGGDYVGRNIRLAAVEGRIVNIAYLQGSRVEADLMPIMLKRLVLTGSTLRARDAGFKASLTAAVREQVWPWVADGDYRPVIHQVFAASEAAQAHQLMESSRHIGKILLRWDR